MHTIITDALQTIAAQGGHQWIAPYHVEAHTSPHQFVLFLKPEITAAHDGVNTERAAELVFDTLENWNIRIGAARVLSGPCLKQNDIMSAHYGVLNSISRNGRTAISPQAEEQLKKLFATELDQGAEVLGAHQFLEQTEPFSAYALSVLSDNMGATKLGGGTYALRVNCQGHIKIILNAFHPYQLEPYTTPGRAIAVLDCSSDHPWADLRTELAGATNPARAAAGSIRNQLLAQQDELNMAEVSQGANGIHLSAGPLEGMVETKRFFSDHESGQTLSWEQTLFGRALLQAGLSEENVSQLAQNPLLDADGDQQPAFDLTEEMDADKALRILTA